MTLICRSVTEISLPGQGDAGDSYREQTGEKNRDHGSLVSLGWWLSLD